MLSIHNLLNKKDGNCFHRNLLQLPLEKRLENQKHKVSTSRSLKPATRGHAATLPVSILPKYLWEQGYISLFSVAVAKHHGQGIYSGS